RSSFIPSLIARRDTPVARATTETPPYPITLLSEAATRRRIRSSRKGTRERKRRSMSRWFITTSIRQNHLNLFYLFPDSLLEFPVDILSPATYATHVNNGTYPPTRRSPVLLYGASAGVWRSCLAER